MRIAHVTATFPPYYSGTGMVCYHNALGLARLGHQVTVFTANHPPGDYTYPREITVRRLSVLFRVGNAPFLPKLLGLGRFDIVHLHHPFIFGAEMIWAVSKAWGIPYIIAHHNDLIGDGLRRYLFDVYSMVSTRLVFGSARKFAVVSFDHAASCRLAPLFRKRWGDVAEVPNGVDVDLFRPGLDGLSVRRHYGIPDDARVILFVGALDRAHHFKGVAHLLRALSRMEDHQAVLMLIGGGDLKDQFIALSGRLGVAKRSLFVGAMSHKQLSRYYAAADVVVLPSFPPESFGVVLIEAMACGKPVIASNLPGVRSVVSDGEDGLLVRPGDVEDLAEKIQMLLDDPQRRREMGERGRDKVEEKYAWPKIIPRLVRVYEEVLADATPGG
jgi:glycosyltransferase involved in cell wall biosynthesis